MVTGLDIFAPQMDAAAIKALRRCAPIVTPVLPPTGAAGVGSLNPSPGSSPLIMTMSAAKALVGRHARQSNVSVHLANIAFPLSVGKEIASMLSIPEKRLGVRLPSDLVDADLSVRNGPHRIGKETVGQFRYLTSRFQVNDSHGRYIGRRDRRPLKLWPDRVIVRIDRHLAAGLPSWLCQD